MIFSSFFKVSIIKEWILIPFFITNIILYLFKINTYVFLLNFVVFFLLLGFYLADKTKINHLNVLQGENYIVKVIEKSQGKKEWNKAIGIVKLIQKEKSYKNEKILIYFHRDCRINVGDDIISQAKVGEIKNKGNPYEFDQEKFWNSKSIKNMTFLSAGDFKIVNKSSDTSNSIQKKFSNIFDKYFKGDELGVVKALVLGDKSDLSFDTIRAFSNTGAIHVLAVSGLHVGIVLILIIKFLQLFQRWITKNKALIIALILIWFYAFITGFSPSIVRSTIMFSIITIGVTFSRQNNSLNILFFTGFKMLLLQPNYLYDIGFQLSFLAMLGIYTVYPKLNSFIKTDNYFIKQVLDVTLIGLAAQTFTFPLTLYYFHQFPNYFILSNIVMMVTSGFILGGGLLFLFVYWIPVVNKIFVFGLVLLLFITVQSTFILEKLPGAVASGYQVPIFIIIVLYFVIISYIIFETKLIKRISLVLAFLTIIIIQFKRIKDTNNSELYFFNNNSVMFTFKTKNQLFVFFDPTRMEKVKVDFSIQGYQKATNTRINYCTLDKNWKINTTKYLLKTQRFNDHIDVMINSRKYVLALSNKFIYSENQSNVINMPWVESDFGINLKNSCYRISL